MMYCIACGISRRKALMTFWCDICEKYLFCQQCWRKFDSAKEGVEHIGKKLVNKHEQNEHTSVDLVDA